MTRDIWYMTRDTWHATCDMWNVVGGEHSLKISAPKLFWFVIYDILQIRRERLTHWLNQWMNHEADCRTAPATQGLLNISLKNFWKRISDFLSVIPSCQIYYKYSVPLWHNKRLWPVKAAVIQQNIHSLKHNFRWKRKITLFENVKLSIQRF